MDIFVNDITLSFLQWFLVSLIAFGLGLLLGYWLWYKYRSLSVQLEKDLKQEHDRYVNLETEFASLKYKYDELEKEKNTLRASLNQCEGDRVMLKGMLEECKQQLTDGAAGVVESSGAGSAETPAAVGVANKREISTLFTEDNLQVVEGIGPKIEGLLKEAGINSWAALAGAAPETLLKILDEAGPRYRMHNPERWSHEARLASEGKWDDLIQFQKSEDPDGKESPSKVEKMTAKLLGFSSSNPEDLKIIEGVGPKIEQLLKDAGINTWSDLAGAAESRLREILAEAGDRYRLADPSTWSKQAGLAAEGKWGELSEYQAFLQAGKDPES